MLKVVGAIDGIKVLRRQAGELSPPARCRPQPTDLGRAEPAQTCLGARELDPAGLAAHMEDPSGLHRDVDRGELGRQANFDTP